MDKKRTDVLFREVVSLGSFLVTLYVMRIVMRPDFARNIRMKGALGIKRVAQTQADSWQTIANNAATTYNKCRL